MESVSMQGSSQPYVSALGPGYSAANGSTVGVNATASSGSATADLLGLGGNSSQRPNGMMELIENLVQMMMGFIERLMSQLFSGGAAPPQGFPAGGAPSAGTLPVGAPPANGSGESAGEAPPSSETPAEPVPGNPIAGGASESPITAQRALEAVVDDRGEIVVLTEDGYTVRCEGKQEAWTITGPDGKITRIWGDPHVQESDGDRWDFTERSSFQFGHNKITVEVKPLNNGTSLTNQITVYNGKERVTVSHIDENKPQITSVSSDGREHDAGLSDGKLYSLRHEVGSADEQWIA